ncbi:MAG: terminase large subunit domain-containing protein [Alsobacter sp.]
MATAFNFPRSLIQLSASEALKLPPEQLQALKYEWDLWKLPHQCPPEWQWDTWLQIGGRGTGKNWGVVQEIRKDVYRGVRRFNFVGRNSAHIRDDMVNGETGIIAAFPPHQKPQYLSSHSLVRFHTGAEALMLSAETPENIQGKNAERTWCDEFSTYGEKTEATWDQVCLSTRVGDPRKYVTTNSLPDNDYLRKLLDEAETRRIAVTRATSYDNFSNLPPAYQQQILEMSKTAYGRAWITGDFYEPEGALWKSAWFKYLPEAPPGGRCIVAVDPAGTKDGDETGIVVAKRVGNFGYVLEDLSGRHDPEKWPKLLVDTARRYKASIVIERNRGLDYLRALIRPLDRQVAIKEINVAGKKQDRFLPIANYYELGKIFHCPKMPELEKQMCNWVPNLKGPRHSPDRVDATVYALNELGFQFNVFKTAHVATPLPTSTF